MYFFPKTVCNLGILFSLGSSMKFYNNVLISNNSKRNFARFLLFRTTFHPYLLESTYLLHYLSMHLSIYDTIALKGVEIPKSHLDAPPK